MCSCSPSVHQESNQGTVCIVWPEKLLPELSGLSVLATSGSISTLFSGFSSSSQQISAPSAGEVYSDELPKHEFCSYVRVHNPLHLSCRLHRLKAQRQEQHGKSNCWKKSLKKYIMYTFNKLNYGHTASHSSLFLQGWLEFTLTGLGATQTHSKFVCY